MQLSSIEAVCPGDLAFVHEMLMTFHEDIGGVLGHLATLEYPAEAEKLRKLAHMIKGVCKNMRLTGLSEPAQMLEVGLKELVKPGNEARLHEDARIWRGVKFTAVK